MNPAAASVVHSTGEAALFVSIELSNSKWDVGSKMEFGQKPRCKTVPAKDLVALEQELCRAKKRFDLPDEAPVLCCYEAGRDGFSNQRGGLPALQPAFQTAPRHAGACACEQRPADGTHRRGLGVFP